MKNLFKKLAFMLALMMVVGNTTPAAPVSAAAAPVLSTTGKVLYLDGDETGKISDTFTLKVWNKGDYRVTYKSLTPEIATVSKWWGTVTAVAVGTATIEATVTNLETGKDVAVLTSKVWVKNNAEEVGFSTASLAKVEEALTVGDSAKLNAFRQDGDVVAWSTKKDAITDYIVYESSNTEVATVSKWGTVTAVAPGEAVITATAYQTEGKTATTASASVNVTVKASGLVAATQKNVTTANVVAGSALTKEEFNKDTVKVYSLVGSTKVAQVVKSATIDSTDATKATVELFVGFAKETTYVVEYADTSVEFVGADTSADAVKSIVVNTTKAVKGEATELKYSLLTETGVDITSAISGRVDFTTSSHDCFIDSSSNKITFYEVGKVAEVKATFHTYKYTEAGVEEAITATVAVTSVDKATYSLGTVKAWTFDADGAFDFDNDTIDQKISLSESTSGRYLLAKFVKNDADSTKAYTDKDPLFTFESSNASVLVVGGSKVYPVNTGTATVIIKYDGTVVDAITVTVLPKRVAATLTVTTNKTIVSSAVAAQDSATVKVEVKDQLGSKFDSNKAKVTLLSSPDNGTVAGFSTSVATDVSGSFTVAGADFSKAGTYQFKVTAGDLTKVIAIVVKDAKATTTQKLEISTREVDTTLKLTSDSTKNKNLDVAIKLYDVDADGTKVALVSGSSFHYTKDTAKLNKDSKGTAFYYEVVDTDGKLVTGANIDTATDKFAPITVSGSAITTSGSAITKVKAGTYRVTAYKLTTATDGKETVTALGADYITVKDAQVAAVVTQKQVEATASSIEGALAAGDIVIKLDTDGNNTAEEIQASCTVDSFVGENASGKTVYLKTVKYSATVYYDGVAHTYEMKIDVNKTLVLK